MCTRLLSVDVLLVVNGGYAASRAESLWLSDETNTLEARLSLARFVEHNGKPEAFRTGCGRAAAV